MSDAKEVEVAFSLSKFDDMPAEARVILELFPLRRHYDVIIVTLPLCKWREAVGIMNQINPADGAE